MNIFEFIFYLGIINIIFGFVWKWVFVFPASLLFALLRFDYGMMAVKVFGCYLLVSLTTRLTLIALGDAPYIFVSILYPFIGALVIFMGFASNAYEARKEARGMMDWQMLETLKKYSSLDAILMLSSTGLYLIALFFPIIATNTLIEWLMGVVNWAYGLPVIGWLIGMGGAFFLLGIIFNGTLAVGFFIAMIVGKYRKEQTVNFLRDE